MLPYDIKAKAPLVRQVLTNFSKHSCENTIQDAQVRSSLSCPFYLAVAGDDCPLKVPRAFASDSYSTYYSNDWKNLTLDSQCHRLRGDFYHNIGSIYIPCQSLAPAGKKNICTFYRDTACTNEESMVTFDHSHYDMFNNGDKSEKTYVGGIVGSINCEVVDTSTAVSNTNGSPFTQHQSQCVGKSCNSDNDCHRDATGSLYCSKHKSHSNTCQLARALPAGASCLETEQCEEGYCSGPRDAFSNASLSESHSICVISVQSVQMVERAAIIHLFVAITVKLIARIWSKSARLLACPATATRPVAQKL